MPVLAFAAQDGTGTNVFESVRIKDGRSVTFGGETRTNWPDGGSTVYGVIDETAYRGDWGASMSGQVAILNGQVAILNTNTAPLQSFLSVSNLVENGPLITNSTAVAIGKKAYGASGGVGIGMNATSAAYSVSIGRNSFADLYGVAVGNEAYAAANSVALGNGVVNSEGGTTKILGQLVMNYDGNSSNGAPMLATGSSGKAVWGSVVAFYASLTNANFLITNSVIRKILFQPPFGATEYNLNSAFENSTFTAPVAGIYQFSACLRWGRKTGTGGYIVYLLYINGGIAQRFPVEYSSAYSAGYCYFPPIIRKLNAGDQVHLSAIGRAASTNYIGEASVGAQYTFFNGILLRELP